MYQMTATELELAVHYRRELNIPNEDEVRCRVDDDGTVHYLHVKETSKEIIIDHAVQSIYPLEYIRLDLTL